jgi:hypothetical protein
VCARARVCVYVCVPVYDVCAHGCGGGGVGGWCVCGWVGGWGVGGGGGRERERLYLPVPREAV